MEKVAEVLGVKDTPLALRWTNTKKLMDYVSNDRVDSSTIFSLDKKELGVETVFLALRTQEGVKDLSTYSDVLEPDWKDKLISWEEQGFVTYEDDRLRLTDLGMDIYNELITELLKFDK